MKCDEVYLHICDSLDENLGSPKCRAIKRHLEQCPECRSYLSSLKTTIALYRAVPEPKLPAEAHKNLFKTISTLTAKAARACRQPRKSHTKNPARDQT
jgi:anti-sigma factor RsiW